MTAMCPTDRPTSPAAPVDGRTDDPGTGVAIGVDAGGTGTRALAVAADGRVLGDARAGGGNPNAHPPAEAAAAVREAVREAIRRACAEDPADGATTDGARVRACVVGMAGASRLADPGVCAVYDREWAGLDVAPCVLSDAETAFASATAEPDGTVLVAGTGSVAGRIRHRRMIATTGGYGWLLGDEGSGFWLGRQAVRAALDALTYPAPHETRSARDGHAPRDGAPELPTLARSVLEQAGVDPDAPDAARRLITMVNAEPPVGLARYAPLVSTACADGDPVARRVVDRAATLLADTATASRDSGERGPVVLVGGVLNGSGPVGARVRALLRDRLPGVTVAADADGVAGAAWLAALEAFGPRAARPHRVP